jgi:hypothetical protein
VAPSGNQTWLEHLPLVDSPSYKFPFQSRHVPATFDYGMVFRWSSSVSSVLPPRHTSPCRCFGRWSQFLDLIELGDPQHLVGTQKNGVWKRTKHGWIRMDKYKLDDLLDDVSLSYWINLDL